jgi:N-acetylmuramoyl-L-alanine amidase
LFFQKSNFFKNFKMIFFLLIFISSIFNISLASEIKIIVAGEEVEMESPPLMQDDMIFIPVDGKGLSSIANRLGGVVVWQANEKKLSISTDKNKSYFIIGSSEGFILNKPTELTHVPFMHNGHPYVPLNYFSSTIKCYYKFDRASEKVELTPKVLNVSYVDTESGAEIIIDASGPIKYDSTLLSNPPRIAIDIPNAILALEEDINISNNVVKTTKASQFSLSPDVVRVVVELNMPIAAKVASRIRMDQVKLKLDFSNSSEYMAEDNFTPPLQTQKFTLDNNTQQITGVKFEEKNNIRRIYITSTGPISYEWHRLKSPDSRFYIDLTDAVLMEKKLTVPVEDELISDIRVAQNQKSPNIVRIVFKMDKTVEMKIFPSQNISNQLIIEMGTREISEANMLTIGSGYLGYLNNGFKTIVIDPGHGGGDYGAINPETGLSEKEVTLDICLRLQELLNENGWNAILTHSTDRDVTYLGSPDNEELWARVNVANQADADLFLSIHCDACTKPNVRGTSTFYNDEADKSLALALQESLISHLGTANRGIKQAGFYVIKHTKMPSALVEVAFISNSEDAKLLSDPAFRQKAAEGIYNGICRYSGGLIIVGEK